MFYVSKKLSNNKYAVTDTLDDVEEVVSVEDLKNYALKGVRVEGCNWGSREDLIKKGFWSIDVSPHQDKVTVKTGNYYSFSYKQRNEVKTLQGFCYSIDYNNKDVCTFILFDNSIFKCRFSDLISIKKVTQSDKNLVSLMNERVKLSNMIAMKRQEKKNLDIEINKLEATLREYDKKFASLNGVLTVDDFTKRVILYLSNSIKNRLKDAGYRLEHPAYVGYNNNTIHFTYLKSVENAYNSSLCYTEYDGSVFINRDSKTSKEYKSILRAYNKEIRCSIPFDESLVIIEEYLYYQGWYEIKVPDLPFTDELAKKIALQYN